MQLELIDPDTKLPFPSIHHGGRACFAVPDGAKFAVADSVSPRLSQLIGVNPIRLEHVVAVDGRDTLTNDDASARAGGLITGRTYICEGFRTGDDGVREFVCTRLGDGATTAERNGTASKAGLVGVAVYNEKRRPSPFAYPWPNTPHVMKGGPVMRGGGGGGGSYKMGDASCGGMSSRMLVTASATASGDGVGVGDAPDVSMLRSAGPTAGAAAGDFRESRTTKTTWERGELLDTAVIEYDTPEGWTARGVSFAPPPTPPRLGRNPWPADEQKFCDPQTL